MKLLFKPLHQAPRIEHRERPPYSSELVTLQVKFVGLCRTDLQVARGTLAVNRPLVLGHECSGIVRHDPSHTFLDGDAVAVNPLLPDGRFLGLHCDGALQDFIQLPAAQLVRADAVPLKAAAYLEPVAASMAVLKARIGKSQKGVIYHDNRISHLTFLILASLGYDIEWIQAPPSLDVANRYDYAIETVFEETAIQGLLLALKPGGLLVVKSRQYTPTPINPGLLVAKELTLQAVNYYDFRKAMGWLRTHHSLLEPLMGDTYALDEWEQAFDAAAYADAKKIFIALD